MLPQHIHLASHTGDHQPIGALDYSVIQAQGNPTTTTKDVRVRFQEGSLVSSCSSLHLAEQNTHYIDERGRTVVTMREHRLPCSGYRHVTVPNMCENNEKHHDQHPDGVMIRNSALAKLGSPTMHESLTRVSTNDFDHYTDHRESCLRHSPNEMRTRGRTNRCDVQMIPSRTKPHAKRIKKRVRSTSVQVGNGRRSRQLLAAGGGHNKRVIINQHTELPQDTVFLRVKRPYSRSASSTSGRSVSSRTRRRLNGAPMGAMASGEIVIVRTDDEEQTTGRDDSADTMHSIHLVPTALQNQVEFRVTWFVLCSFTSQLFLCFLVAICVYINSDCIN